MTVELRPIPALYTVYVLRSTVRHASVYIGSTNHPPRRLKQHNGKAPGGAARTSRLSLRPWEMVGLVSGFPGQVAALKFEYASPPFPFISDTSVARLASDEAPPEPPPSLAEPVPPVPELTYLTAHADLETNRWALTNPHLSFHIPDESRISRTTSYKKNGLPRRPRATLASVLSNLHLLLRVPSFRRWPLTLHFFSRDVHTAWQSVAVSAEPLQSTLAVVTDFGPDPAAPPSDEPPAPWGINALPVDHAPLKDYVGKGQAISAFEREGNCVVCDEALPHGQGLHAVCPNEDCEGVGHLPCWSRHLLQEEGEPSAVVPTQGHCPQCESPVKWADMMKELTLRERGTKEIEALFKTKKTRERKKKAEKVE